MLKSLLQKHYDFQKKLMVYISFIFEDLTVLCLLRTLGEIQELFPVRIWNLLQGGYPGWRHTELRGPDVMVNNTPESIHHTLLAQNVSIKTQQHNVVLLQCT